MSKRTFSSTLTLRLPSPLRARCNTRLRRFPFTNPHALGLHILNKGLEVMECSLNDAEVLPTPPRTARQHNTPYRPRRHTAKENNTAHTGEVRTKGGDK